MIGDTSDTEYRSYHDILAAVSKADETHDDQLRDTALTKLVEKWDTLYSMEIASDLDQAQSEGIFGFVIGLFSIPMGAAGIAYSLSTKEFSVVDALPALTILGAYMFVDGLKKIRVTDQAKALYHQQRSKIAIEKARSERELY
jgi:hypothetical protein